MKVYGGETQRLIGKPPFLETKWESEELIRTIEFRMMLISYV